MSDMTSQDPGRPGTATGPPGRNARHGDHEFQEQPAPALPAAGPQGADADLVAELKDRVAELENLWRRALADADNMRKRHAREIGRLGAAICYDWMFPEAIRALAHGGADVLIRVSAYMDPWGATPPMDWWTLFNRARAVENFAYVVAANQGASASNYPPFSWPGGSMVVDFDGRILAQADSGPGEKIVVAPIDLSSLRAERSRAERLADMGNFWQMTDPAGLVFCVVGIQTGEAFERYATAWD